MRITAQAKEKTRRRVLDEARKLFSSNGFGSATTRDIARRAGIANGTLFNYFATKEAIAVTLVAEALAEAQEDFCRRSRRGESLEEELFAYIAAGLRRLKPYCSLLGPVLETLFSPATKVAAEEHREGLRTDHMETVTGLLVEHAVDEPSAVLLHLYWTLYTGVLAFWTNDASPNQEDTLAVLDQSLKMFVGWIGSDRARRAEQGG